MDFRQLLTGMLEYNYGVADKLMSSVDDSELNWKPATGKNWMTVGQCLNHMTSACGFCVRGFVTGDWGMPEGAGPEGEHHEDMLPPAEKLPTVTSVAEARKMLADDKALAFKMLADTSDEDLNTKIATAPWDQIPMPLGMRILQMIEHLAQHKGQLYYYQKLMGKDVNTMHLWGM